MVIPAADAADLPAARPSARRRRRLSVEQQLERKRAALDFRAVLPSPV